MSPTEFLSSFESKNGCHNVRICSSRLRLWTDGKCAVGADVFEGFQYVRN
jgi:hypothetical protein